MTKQQEINALFLKLKQSIYKGESETFSGTIKEIASYLNNVSNPSERKELLENSVEQSNLLMGILHKQKEMVKGELNRNAEKMNYRKKYKQYES